MSNSQSRKLPEEVKHFIIVKKQENVKPKLIIEEVQNRYQRTIVHSTINRLWMKFQRTGSTQDLPRSGRPQALNEREERVIVRNLLTIPGTSIKSIALDRARAGQPGSRRTIARTARRNKLIPRTSNRGKEITGRNIIKRLAWAKIMRLWTVLEWRFIVFTDETLLYPKRTKGRVIWYRQSSLPRHEEEPDLRLKGVKVWGFISYTGNRGLVKFEETMNAANYKDLLDNHLREAVPQEEDPAYELVFMQDGAKYHSANDVINHLRQRVDVLSWPPQSPDLNIMENIWAALQQELWVRRNQLRNAGDVWAAAREIFNNFTLMSIRNLYESLPNRINKVIRAKGRRINT